MYTFDIVRLRELRPGRLAGIGANVFFLGLTSLLTDVSSEMVGAILPLYLMVGIGLAPLQFGLVDGLSQGGAAAARLAGGWAADRWRSRRALAASGYALSTACRLLLLLAGHSWGLACASVALDRVGKGVRTAPRDALISLSAAPAQLGLAFGIHRALDTVGALLGPLLAFAMLESLPQAFDLVIGSSFFIALAGLAALLCFVREALPPATARPPDRPRPRAAAPRLRDPRLRTLVVVSAVLGLFTLSDAFFFLMIQDKLAAPVASFPLYYSASSFATLVLSVPLGRLADRFGRARVFLAGHVLIVLALVDLVVAGGERVAVLGALGLLGAYYACTDGVVMALASRLASPDTRAAALGAIAAAGFGARLVGSLLFGLLWGSRGAPLALAVFGAGLAGATVVAARLLARRGLLA